MEAIGPIRLLRRQYLQLLDPKTLNFPKPELLRLSETQRQIYDGMFNESLMVCAPPERYRFRVLKRLVAALEQAIEDPEEDEISDDISECLAKHMVHPLPTASTTAQQKSYVTYTAPTPDRWAPTVTLLEAPSLLAYSGTTGFRTWETALHLASFLFSGKGSELVANKNIIELGAGTGFLSIVCSKHLNASSVLATDGSSKVISDLNLNLELNERGDCDDDIKAKVLQWGQALIGGVADCRKEGRTYDLALGADVTYDVHSMPALVATLRDLFELYPKIKVVISAAVRNEDTLTAFLKACDANLFTTETLEVEVPDESEQIGFFHPTSTPIKVFLITYEGALRDPFDL